MNSITSEIDLDTYYFFNDYLAIWNELNTQVIDDSSQDQYEHSANMMNLVATTNKHFISIFNTKTQKTLFCTDNLTEILGFTCSVADYKDKPLYYWLTSSVLKRAWYMMQLSMFFKSTVKKILHSSQVRPTLRWYHHNIKVGAGATARRVGIQGKALKIAPNGTMLLQMSIMKDVSGYVKDDGKWWSEIIINDDTYYHFHEDIRKIIEGNLLSEREEEVLALVQNGLDSKGISEKLCISSMTVDTHRKNMLQKTGCKDISSLVQVYEFGNLWKNNIHTIQKEIST